MVQQGQVFKLKTRGADGKPLWAYRYRLQGRGSGRRQVGGFATRTEAQHALRKALDRLRPGGRAATLTLAEFVQEYLQAHPGQPVTVSKLRWLLGKATAALGEVRLIDLTPERVCTWRMTIPEGHRYEATQALRQVLSRAVAWDLLDYNPAKRGVPNPLRRSLEKRPFESWQEIELVAAQLGPVYGAMVVFAAATGLRPAELFALEHRDLHLEEGVVYVRRAYANGRVKHVKTRRSMRGVPLQGMALDALRRLPPRSGPLVFPGPRGGYIDLRNFRHRHWRPALRAAGIEPLRQPYDLRHTYATFALRAGLSAFALSRYMGTSLAMIDLHYGHLASDGRQHAVALLDALAREKAVDAGWTPTPPAANPFSSKQRRPRQRVRSDSRGRSVDAARKTRRRPPRQRRC
jgi:integrase